MIRAPELDKTYFWADPRDEVWNFMRLPKRFSTKYGYQMFQMPHVSWSDDNYYLKQVPLANNREAEEVPECDGTDNTYGEDMVPGPTIVRLKKVPEGDGTDNTGGEDMVQRNKF